VPHPEPARDLHSGDRLGRYVIERELGRGGMGAVFAARDERLGRLVALKVIAPALARDRIFRARFEREARIAATLEHPNVVPVYDAGEADGGLFIAMRFIDGHDLGREVAERGALAPGRVGRLLAQVCSALDAAHEIGLVHRDVKPANVLVAGRDAHEHACLSDFGLTRDVASESGLTATGEWLGTVDYAAPEQIEGGALGPRTDVYAVGCLAFHLLTGRVPFLGATPAKLHGHLSAPPPRASEWATGIPPAVDEVLARAMAKDWRERQPAAGLLARDLVAALDAPAAPAVARADRAAPTVTAPGAPTPARGPSPAPDAAAPRRHRMVPALIAGLAAVVAAVAVAVALSANRSGPGTTQAQSSATTVTITGPARTEERTITAPAPETNSVTTVTTTTPAVPPATQPATPPRRHVARFTTGRDAGQATIATACRVADAVLTCWTPNDGFTVELPGHGSAVRVRSAEPLNRGRQPDHPALGFGEPWSVGAFRCVSRNSGLTCSNADGHGWTLPRYRGLPAYF
jgi:Protein kinase domain